MLLEARGLQVTYGPTQAIKDMSLYIAEGEIVTVLGANGAGKTSLLKALQVGKLLLQLQQRFFQLAVVDHSKP